MHWSQFHDAIFQWYIVWDIISPNCIANTNKSSWHHDITSGFPSQRSTNAGPWCLFCCYHEKSFNKQSKCQWLETQAMWHKWSHCLFDLVTCSPKFDTPHISRLMGPTSGPPGDDRTQVGPMLAPWTWLSGIFSCSTFSDLEATVLGEHSWSSGLFERTPQYFPSPSVARETLYLPAWR